jgi:NTP pyrophosphatase (non-canonical NTP hydrolase)
MIRTEHFNQLTPAEDERLAKLAEECAEVIQAIMKVMRHGYRRHNPDALGMFVNETNREGLQREIADVMIAIARMTHAEDVNGDTIEDITANELRHSGRYMHHQGPEQQGVPAPEATFNGYPGPRHRLDGKDPA